MDPITLMASVTATYNGVKKAVAMGREAHDIMRQLGKWAECADKMYSVILNEQVRKPGLFENIKFEKSETREALDIAAAKIQLKKMEDDIRNMFFYGELQELGQAGYSEFIQNRKRIKEERNNLLKEQASRRSKFIESVFWNIVLCIVLVFALFFFWIIYELGAKRNYW